MVNAMLDVVDTPAAWAASVAASAYISWIVKTRLDRGRPRIQIASLTIDDRVHTDKVITIPGALHDAYRTLPIALDNFDERMSLTSVYDAIDYVDLTLQQVSEVRTCIQEAIAELDRMAADSDKGEMRTRVLKKLYRGGAISIDSVIRRSLQSNDLYSDIESMGFSERYASHPTIEDLKALKLNDYSFELWNLSEISAQDLPRDRYDNQSAATEARATNLIRRVFLYCDKQVFKRFLDVTVENMNRDESSCEEFRAELKFLVTKENPENVWCEVVITNLGRTPCIFDGETHLNVKTGSGVFSIKMVRSEGIPTSPIVVKSNDTQTVLMRSTLGIDSLVVMKGPPERAPLEGKINARGLVETKTNCFSVSFRERQETGRCKDLQSDDFVPG